MGPARVHSEDGFSHPGFRTLDALATTGSAYMDAVESIPLKRKQAFQEGLSSIHPGANYHVSPLGKSAVTFSYHLVSDSSATEPGDPFDDVTRWQFSDQLSTSLYGGTQNAFGSFYTSQSSTPALTCAAWSRSDRPGYSPIQAYRVHPVPGLSQLYISGALDCLKYNSRPNGENTTISWKLVQYHSNDLNSNFSVLTSGQYLVKNVGTEIAVQLEGDNIVAHPPKDKGIFVQNFVEGSIALVIKNNYTEEIPSYGHVLVCDDIIWRFGPQIPYTRGVEDLSPLLVDPANGTVYSAVLTPGFPNLMGALWHTAKVVVGFGFETRFLFKISEISETCKTVAQPHKNCDTRGGDGFALVFHNSEDGEQSLGEKGMGLGYSGIKNGLAIEFDTWYNADDGDPYMNHISIQTRGKDPLSSNHKYSVAATSDIMNFADNKIHEVRVVYRPNIDLASYITRSRIRQANDRHQTPVIAYKHLFKFLSKDTSRYRMGQLSVFLDSNPQAIMEIPINLPYALGLDTHATYGAEDQMAKAWIGFTASTGTAFQRHEIFEWHYTAMPTTHRHTPPPAHCATNTLPYDDDPSCHSPKLCLVDDRMESEHVGPNDPRNPRGAGHPGHYMSKYARNCDKFYKPQGNNAPQLYNQIAKDLREAVASGEILADSVNIMDISQQSGRADPMPSDGGIASAKLRL